MGSDRMPLVSVAIVNWNTRHLLRACLASLPWASSAVGVEAIVVDNGSEDDSAAMVREEFPQAILIRNAENRGFVTATNQALDRASGDLLLLLNSDTEVREGCVERLVEVAASDEHIGAVGPRLLNSDGSHQQSSGPFPRFIHRLVPSRFEQRYARRLEARLKASPEHIAPVDWLIGAALLFRRDVLEAVGPLDERFFMWYEDIDWCRRLARAGYSRVLVADAVVTHHGRGSGGKLDQRVLTTQLLESEYTYLRLHGGRVAVALIYALRVGKALPRRALGSPATRLDAAERLTFHRRRFRQFCLRPLPSAESAEDGPAWRAGVARQRKGDQ
jgi:N-acetylglucosaminyl-diphospho-decaprenol L-rhamnosyltransferase